MSGQLRESLAPRRLAGKPRRGNNIYGRDGVDEVCGGDASDYLWGGAAGYDCVCGGKGGEDGNEDTATDYLYGDGGGGDMCYGDASDSYDTGTCETYASQDCSCGCDPS